MRLQTLIILSLTPLMLVGGLSAQGLTIDWHSIDSGSNVAMSGGSLAVAGTIGQPDAGVSDGRFVTVQGGFWDLVDPASMTPVQGLRAIAGPRRVRLEWEQTRDDMDTMVVERMAPNGSILRINEIAINGTGRYTVVDAFAFEGSTYRYQVSERHTPGPTIPRGAVDARPYSQALPLGMARVGRMGHPNISSAIAAGLGKRRWVIAVEPGTYPAFSLDATAPDDLRIMADGTGDVIIDTSSVPVTIRDRAATQTLELRGLQIGSSTSANHAITVRRCFGPILLDDLDLQAGPSKSGLYVRSSIALTVQRSDIAGSPGVSMGSGSFSYMSRGSVDELDLSGSSTLTMCQLAPGSATVEAGSSRIDLPGIMPNLDAPAFLTMNFPTPMEIESFPSSGYLLWFAARHGFLPSFETVGLLDFGTTYLYTTGSVDENGRGMLSLAPPPEPLILGNGFPFQMLSLDPSNGTNRWSNATTVIPMR